MSPPDPLEALYDEHAPALFRFLVRLTGDEARVKDILQELFIRLAREPGLLCGVRSSRSYLLRMAHRRAIDLARREAVHDRKAGQAAQEQTDAPPPPDLDAGWRRSHLADALATLPHDQRAVVLLKVWEELTFAEIGETLAIPPETAASRYRYALNKLRDALRPLKEDLR